MDRHDRPVGDRLASTDLLEVQRTLAVLGVPRDLAPPAAPSTCDETLAMRLARFLRLVMRLAW